MRTIPTDCRAALCRMGKLLPACLIIASSPGCGPSVDDVRRISAAELHAAQAAGEALIVDARPRRSYDALHISEAVSAPLEEARALAGELPREKLIATYCT